MKPALIFDFDDTLADSYSASLYASRVLDVYGKYRFGVNNFGKVFDSFDVALTKVARTKKDISLLKRQSWALLTANKLKLNISKQEANEITNLYWYAVYKSIKQSPNAKSVLTKLKKKYDLYLLSDADGDVKIKMQKVKEVGLSGFFKGYSLGDIIKTTKPDNKYYSYLIKKHKINPKTTVMIGDRPTYDLEPAKKLGMKTIWIKQGRWKKIYNNKKFKYVDHTITDLKQLVKIL